MILQGEITLQTLLEVDLDKVDTSAFTEEQHYNLYDIYQKLHDFSWICDDCGATAYGDFTSGVELDCEYCGSVCTEHDDATYVVAEWLENLME